LTIIGGESAGPLDRFLDYPDAGEDQEERFEERD
jgi:hypothetical protein